MACNDPPVRHMKPRASRSPEPGAADWDRYHRNDLICRGSPISVWLKLREKAGRGAIS